MTANHWDADLIHIIALRLCNKGASTANIQGGHAHQLLWIVDTFSFENLPCNRNSGVHRVRYDEDASVWASISTTSNQVFDDSCIGIEEVIACHARLSWN